MLSDDDLKSLETTHKRVARVTDKNGAWECVYRKPSRAEYKRMRAMMNNDTQKADATEWLARATVVYPSREAYDALLEDYPGIADASGTALAELLGFTADAVGKT